MKTIKTIMPMLFIALFIFSCKDDMKEMEKEQEKDKEQEVFDPNFDANTNWTETTRYSDSTFTYNYTDIEGNTALDEEFSFIGKNQTAQTYIKIVGKLENGKTHTIPDSGNPQGYQSSASWQLVFVGETFRNTSGSLTVTNFDAAKIQGLDGYYVDGSYTITLDSDGKTVTLNGTFEDLPIIKLISVF